MLRGLATIRFWADDLEAAKQWYAGVLGIDPYFERPGYHEFRLGDYEHELGLIDSRFAPVGSGTRTAGPRVYWHVDDVPATMARMLAMGAKEYEAPVGRGEGFITASVIDPFGNVLGIMYNPHYLDVLNSSANRQNAGTHLPYGGFVLPVDAGAATMSDVLLVQVDSGARALTHRPKLKAGSIGRPPGRSSPS
jgi:catechol 2,3-dioxygenase-like lactoylglutathione lyase family enzyme